MSAEAIGIGDIGLYVPPPRIELDELVRRRVGMNPRLDRHLARAGRVTGQTAIRFPEIWEDSATLAATAVRGLLAGNPSFDVASVRHLAVGTETGVDHSKPVSAYLQGMLEKAGIAIPHSLSSFQVQHACAGGTMALLGVAGMLAAGGRPADTGIVVSTDIARYETASTAEITQGAGAVALAVERAPRLVELDLSSVGFHSLDVDDFFRPLGSETARVNGGYSMRCYSDGLVGAFTDHCARRGEKPDRVLQETDYLVLHTPFRNMPGGAMEHLLQAVLGLDPERARAFLAERSFDAAIEPLARIGNLYTGSLTAGLMFLLAERCAALGRGIAGKRLVLASYGSGNTMVVVAGRVSEGAAEVISRWDLSRVEASARAASFEEYEAWTNGPVQPELHARLMENARIPAGAFALSGIRKDGYREYQFSKAVHAGAKSEEREAPDDLHGSVAISG